MDKSLISGNLYGAEFGVLGLLADILAAWRGVQVEVWKEKAENDGLWAVDMKSFRVLTHTR